MPLDYLAKLNTEQRQAVEHGVGGEAGGLAVPLLVIAGAGSGKTNSCASHAVHQGKCSCSTASSGISALTARE